MIIYREDNFLQKDYCDHLINIFKNNTSSAYRDTFIFKYEDLNVVYKVSKIFTNYNLKTPDNMEIVEWPTNSKMDPHHDVGDSFAFIIYLNDNFDGGETVIDGVSIRPKIGRLVLFSNGIYKHEVKKVNKGIRYTLIAWYTK